MQEGSVTHNGNEGQEQFTGRYLALLNAIDEALAVCVLIRNEKGEGIDYRVLEANPAFERQSGINAEALLGRTAIENFPSLDRHRVKSYASVVDRKEAFRFEEYSTDTQRWCEIAAYPVEGDQFLILGKDITDRKLRERQHEHLLYLNDVLRATEDPIEVEQRVCLAAMEYFEADRCYYCTMKGDDAIINRDAARDGLPSVAGTYPMSGFALFKKVVDEGRTLIVNNSYTSEILDEDLRQLCIQLQVISFVDVPVVKNGKVAGVLCLVQSTPRNWTQAEKALIEDVAERTWAAVERAAAEQALRKSEQKYRSLFESIDEGFVLGRILLNDEGTPVDYLILEVNPVYEKMTGIKKEDVIGRTVREITPTIEDVWIATVGRVATTGESVRFENPVAELGKWFETYLSPADDSGDGHFVAVFKDVTERKRAEEILRASEEDLARQVAERTAELQRSNEDLRQFAHVASHDLKEPIRKIKTFNNRVLEEYLDRIPEKARTYLEKVDVSTNRMLSMIDGVLRYSKLGSTELLLQTVDLNETLRNIGTDLEVLIQQKGAKITADALPTITASEVLMYQLFYNLILNSLKFARAGVRPAIHIGFNRATAGENDVHRIIVSDNGIGFEAEFGKEIFKTFTRLNPPEEYEGTGLGLALCKKIVERHGGTITAEGHPGEGAAFTVQLPIR